MLPQLTAVDVHQLIHERCRRYVSGTHQDKEVKVVFHISTDTPATIMADPEILFQVRLPGAFRSASGLNWGLVRTPWVQVGCAFCMLPQQNKPPFFARVCLVDLGTHV